MSAAPTVDSSGQLAPAPPAVGADAAQGLFERHAGALYGFCLNRLGNREEAEDAVQTTFLNAFGALRRGAVPEYEAAWLYTIAENVCRGRHRSARRRLEVVQDPSVLAEIAPAADRGGDELFGLDAALGRMAPRQRRALLLREWHGLSYREIARELRLSPAAVETLLFRARRSLARNLQAGSLIPWLKSLLGGSAAAKTAAAASVVVAIASLAGGAAVDPAALRPVRERATAAQLASAVQTSTAPAGADIVTRTRVPRAGLRGASRLGPGGDDAAARLRPPERTGAPTDFGPGGPVPATAGPASSASPAAPTNPPRTSPAPAPPAPASRPPAASLPLPLLPPPALPQLPPLPPPPLPPAPQLPLTELTPPPELPLPELPQLPQLP